jgi:hypothetical protein
MLRQSGAEVKSHGCLTYVRYFSKMLNGYFILSLAFYSINVIARLSRLLTRFLQGAGTLCSPLRSRSGSGLVSRSSHCRVWGRSAGSLKLEKFWVIRLRV